MVLTPEGEGVLRDLAWQLQGVDAAITMQRDPVYVESERVAYVDAVVGLAELAGPHVLEGLRLGIDDAPSGRSRDEAA
jgi:hypothetical protein